jgi:ParB/RepB/Spo0J family partition protein
MHEQNATTVWQVPLDLIVAGDNDRRHFDPAAIRALADSLALIGLQQAPTLRKLTDGRYEIIMGECRTRAARLLGWATIPAFVVDLDDRQAHLRMAAENMARRDLAPIEEARAFERLRQVHGLSVDEIARAVGQGRAFVEGRLRLLRLDDTLLPLVGQRHGLALQHAQALADSALDHNLQVAAWRKLCEATTDDRLPAVGWFRALIGQMEAAAAQLSMFDAVEFDATFATLCTVPDTTPAALPGQDEPPTFDGAPADILRAQAAWWRQQADRWAAQGRKVESNACTAAAAALDGAAAALPAPAPAPAPLPAPGSVAELLALRANHYRQQAASLRAAGHLADAQQAAGLADSYTRAAQAA